MPDRIGARIASLKHADRLQALFLALGALGAAGGAALTVAPEGVRQPALVAIAGLLCVAPLVARMIQKRWDPFEPIVVLCAAAFVMFFLRPLWMWMHDDWIFGIFDARDGFIGAITIAVAGIAAMVIGYSLGWGPRLAEMIPPVRDDWDPKRVVMACCAFLAIGTVLFAFYIGVSGGAVTTYFSGRSAFDDTLRLTAGGERATTGYFAFAPYVVIPIAFVMIEVWRRRRSFAIGVFAAFAVFLALLMTVPRGDRTFVLALAMPLIAIPYLLRNRRPSPVAIVVSILVAILLANVLLSYRQQGARHESLFGAIAEGITHPVDTVDEFMLGVDTTNINTLAATYEAIPDRLEYRPAGEVISIAALPIPGLLWANKPEEPGQYVYYELFPQRTRAGVAASMFGGFYADSWYIGVIVYSLLWGMLARVLYEYWRKYRHNASVCIVFAAMLPMLIIMFRASPKLMIGGIPFLILPIVAAFWWGSRRPGRRSVPAGARPGVSAYPGGS